jgi:hypothetical protein
MQMDQAAELRHQHAGKTCYHPHIEKEYDRGGQTGDYVCSECGTCFCSSAEWEFVRASLQKSKDEQGPPACGTLTGELEGVYETGIFALGSGGWLLLDRRKFSKLEVGNDWGFKRVKEIAARPHHFSGFRAATLLLDEGRTLEQVLTELARSDE